MTSPNGSSLTPKHEGVYFLRLDFSDVRCFAGKHSLDLSTGRSVPNPWTLILGENGVGKTTLLELLEQLRPTLPANPPRAGELADAVPFLFRGNWRGPHPFWRSDTEPFEFNLLLSRRVGLRGEAGPKATLVVHGLIGVKRGRAGLDGDPVHATTYGYGASRRVETDSSKTRQDTDDNSLLLADAAHLRDPERWLLDATVSATQDSPLRTRAEAQLAQVKAILVRVLPDVTDVRVSTTERSGRITSFVEVQGLDGWVPYASLSLGYRTMTAWMVDLAIRLFHRYPDLDDPLSGPGVCLIDEIDLHLHPRWQRSLIATVSKIFPNVQFIATAHSPLMVQSATDANIVVLRRGADGRVVIDNDPPNVAKWRVDQILTSELFGLTSARAPELDEAMRERDGILGKPELTDEDEKRLAELSKVIGAVPYGDTPEDIEASNSIRLAAKSLTKSP